MYFKTQLFNQNESIATQNLQETIKHNLNPQTTLAQNINPAPRIYAFFLIKHVTAAILCRLFTANSDVVMTHSSCYRHYVNSPPL